MCLFTIPIFAFSESAFQSDRTQRVVSSKKALQNVPAIPTVRISTNLILIPISVRDRNDNPVTNLRMNDFAISENGIPVPVEHFGMPELTQLDVVLVFDLTSSLWFYFDLVKEASSGFVRSLYRPGDSVSVVGISSEPKILLERNDSLPAILDGLNGLPRFGAATAFFDAVIAATRIFSDHSDPETRHVVVVLSDGEDNLSRRTLEDALLKLQKTDSIFYSINPGASEDGLNRVSLRGQKYMETLAEQTGGTAFMAESFSKLSSIYSRIAEELQVQYLLGYNATENTSESSYRTIEVSLPDRPDLRIRARKGYYANQTEDQ